jgi:hypothetical protein
MRKPGEFAKPFRITDGKQFRLKDIDPGDTNEFKSKEQDKRNSTPKTGERSC